MTITRAEQDAWHLDKKVPIALMLTILLQSSTAVWWASSIENRVGYIAKSDDSQNLKIQAVESNAQSLAVNAATITAQITALGDRMLELKSSQRETNDLLRQLTTEARP